jgi:glycerophosphoryl diester phosphodiesterase
MHACVQVHPYTFRNEANELAFNYSANARAEYALFLKDVGVDGAFTDFPGTMFDWLTGERLKGTPFQKMLPRI